LAGEWSSQLSSRLLFLGFKFLAKLLGGGMIQKKNSIQIMPLPSALPIDLPNGNPCTFKDCDEKSVTLKKRKNQRTFRHCPKKHRKGPFLGWLKVSDLVQILPRSTAWSTSLHSIGIAQ
jgi:hypothetical protein